MLLAVLFYVFMTVIFIEIIYFALVIYSFHNNSNQSKKSDVAISLLLYTKNNEELLKKQLPVFLKQKHKNYEIVLINHASTDGSLEVMENVQKKNPTIKIIDRDLLAKYQLKLFYLQPLILSLHSHNALKQPLSLYLDLCHERLYFP